MDKVSYNADVYSGNKNHYISIHDGPRGTKVDRVASLLKKHLQHLDLVKW